MINWIKRHCILSIFLSLLAFCSVPAGLNYSGFCFEQGRWLSDEEKIRIVISANFLNQPDIIRLYGEKDFPIRKNLVTRYKNFEDFMEKNPNCCRFDITKTKDIGQPILGERPAFPLPDFWSKVYDYYSDVMVVKLGVYHIDENGNNRTEYIFPMNNCVKGYYP